MGQKAVVIWRKRKRKGPPASLVALLLVFPPALCSAGTVACREEFPAPPPRACGIGIVSLNLHEVQDSDVILGNLRRVGDLSSASLILLQEVVHPGGGKLGVADRLAQSLDMQVFFAPAFNWRKGSVQGLAILSRYPILERRVLQLPQFNLRWRSRHRIALRAVVDTPPGRIRIYNVHLDTRLNLDQRIVQLTPVVEDASTAEGAIIVAGDFNTNPYRWLQHTIPLLFGPDQPSGIQQYLARFGFESAFPRKTITSRWLRMQLDWIFLRGLLVESVAYRPMKFSDHYAIYSRLDLPLRETPRHPPLEGP